MSVEQIKRIRLMRRLDERNIPQSYHPKSQIKRKYTSTSFQPITLNKNKKYQLEEEKNTEIERNNRLLYEKISNNFKELKQSFSKIQGLGRHKWRKRKQTKHILHLANEESFYNQQTPKNKLNSSRLTEMLMKARAKTESVLIQQIPAQQLTKTLFIGVSQIDGISFHLKITINRTNYLLIGSNQNSRIMLQMSTNQYLKLHNTEFKGNPCNIFQYLQINGGKLRFRERNEQSKISKSKAMLK